MLLQELPTELLLNIMCKLDPINIAALAQTCKHYHALSQAESLWINVILKGRRHRFLSEALILNGL